MASAGITAYRLIPAALLGWLTACGSAPPLEIFGEVPEFVLTSERDQPFSTSELAGRVWIANFIFTNCPGPCPRMSTQMKALQEEIPPASGIRFVSITVDPARDTPAVLAAYARRFQADSARWTLLTGDLQRIHDLSRNAFKLQDVDGSLTHSTKFVLVDGQRNIRGYYSSDDAGDLRRLARDAQRLARGDP